MAKYSGSANLALSIDSSDNLLWNGDIIATSSASPVLSITGTANQIIASAATGNVTLSTPQNIGTGSSPTFDHLTLAKTTNQLILGTTNTVTLSSTAPSVSRTYTIPDAGGAANVMLDAGAYTVTGTWTGVTLVAPALGTPASGVLTNCTSIPAAGITGTLGVTHGGTGLATFTQGDLILLFSLRHPFGAGQKHQCDPIPFKHRHHEQSRLGAGGSLQRSHRESPSRQFK
jgi:hypothetical protein